MLDEIKEFEQYTFELNDEKLGTPLKRANCRLKKNLLIDKNFAGITRALTIIARYYMFNTESEFNINKVEDIKDMLRAWCGFATQKSIPESEKRIEGWLGLYIRKAFFYRPAEACVKEFKNCKASLQDKLDDFKNRKAEIKKQRPRLGDKNLVLAVEEKHPELIDAIIFDKLEKIFPETIAKNEKNKDATINEKAEAIALKATVDELAEKKQKFVELEKTYKDAIANTQVLSSLIKRVKDVKDYITVLVKLKNKAKSYNKSIYSSSFNNKPFDLNTITLERILANAFAMGKLEQYYLVCDCNPFEENIVKKNTTKSNAKGKKKDGETYKDHLLSPINSDKDLILKITAYYLLQKRYNEQDYVVFNKTDMANWMWKKGKTDNIKLNIYGFCVASKNESSSAKISEEELRAKLLPMFDTITIGEDKEKGKKGTPITKIKAHPEWVKQFRLVKYSDIGKSEKKALWLSDGCHNSHLIENYWTGTPVFTEEKKEEAEED